MIFFNKAAVKQGGITVKYKISRSLRSVVKRWSGDRNASGDPTKKVVTRAGQPFFIVLVCG